MTCSRLARTAWTTIAIAAVPGYAASACSDSTLGSAPRAAAALLAAAAEPDEWAELDVLAESMCDFVQCYESRAPEPSPDEIESKMWAIVATYNAEGIKTGLSQLTIADGRDTVGSLMNVLTTSPPPGMDPALHAAYLDALPAMDADLEAAQQ